MTTPLAGVATPYIIGYYSEWVTESQGFSSNIILFDQEYYPEYVYICQNSNTMEAIANGNVFNARPFAENDTLALIINALNASLEEAQSLTYYLAVDGKKNNGWVKVPLTALGKTSGLSFRMTTTDTGDFGSNTPLYFALDALTINTAQPTALPNIPTPSTSYQKIIVDGQLLLSGETVYTLLGQTAQSMQ